MFKLKIIYSLLLPNNFITRWYFEFDMHIVCNSMVGIYLCQYITNDKNICNKSCYRQEGCAIHWKRRQHDSCEQCGRPTASEYKLCNLHIGKYHSRAHYYQKKLAKMTQNISESKHTVCHGITAKKR